MLINVIALGPTGIHWDGSGESIGVNDAGKWGFKIQRLVLLNDHREFANEPKRLQTINKTNADVVYTCCRDWLRVLPNTIYFRDNMWAGQIKPRTFQTSRTSPFCAISIAYNLGFDEIVLWGVDFKDHPIWNKQNHFYEQEIKNYQQLAEQLKARGVMIYNGRESVLNLPVYAG